MILQLEEWRQKRENWHVRVGCRNWYGGKTTFWCFLLSIFFISPFANSLFFFSSQTWSPQLAEVACYTAKTCRFFHDQCRSTGKAIEIHKFIQCFWSLIFHLLLDEFRHAGQNLAIIAGYKDYLTMAAAMNQEVYKWFNEVKLTTHDDIKKYPVKPRWISI